MRLWSGSDRAGKYIWYSMVTLDIPTDTCDIIWVELWGRVFWEGDEGFSLMIINEADGFALDTGIFCGSDTWQILQIRVDLVGKTLDYFLEGDSYGDQEVLEHVPDTVMILARGLSDGSIFTPGSLIDDFRIYDDGYL